MGLSRTDGITRKILLVIAVVLWLPPIVAVLNEAIYFVGFVVLGGHLWIGRSRFYRPRKPGPLSSASGGTTATASGATAATGQTLSSETGQADDEKEFQPAAAIVGFFLFLLQMFASTYWYVRVPENPAFDALVGPFALVGTSLLAQIINILTE